jgi:hypothetical protein
MVQTKSGTSGRIVFISPPKVFVLFAGESEASQIKPFRANQLTFINRLSAVATLAKRAA